MFFRRGRSRMGIIVLLLGLTVRQWWYNSKLLPVSSESIALETFIQGPPNKDKGKSLDTRDHLPMVLFYNIFLPPETYPRALEIVKEQLQLIQNSCRETSQRVSMIYYTTMGQNVNNMDNQNGTVQSLCETAGLPCQHLQHYDQGDEVFTLQAMYEYCQKDERLPFERVAYLHNKGSFHDTLENAKLRNPLTRAVVHPDCWNPPNATCNSCGLVFLNLPFPTMPGNFFVSHCDYLRLLIPPLQFERRMRQLTDWVQQDPSFSWNRREANQSSLLSRPSWLGVDRYAAEYWAHSHPNVIPCDLSQRLKVWFRARPQPMKWQMYPRPALSQRARNQPDVTFDGYFSLEGQLVKWQYLYGRLPSWSSWVWSRYGGGDEWKGQLEAGTSLASLLGVTFPISDEEVQ